MDDLGFLALQMMLLRNPMAGDLIPGVGGLRKVRFADLRRQKGKRGGLRIIYYWWSGGAQFWLFTVYGKNEQDDLSPVQRKTLESLLATELRERTF